MNLPRSLNATPSSSSLSTPDAHPAPAATSTIKGGGQLITDPKPSADDDARFIADYSVVGAVTSWCKPGGETDGYPARYQDRAPPTLQPQMPVGDRGIALVMTRSPARFEGEMLPVAVSGVGCNMASVTAQMYRQSFNLTLPNPQLVKLAANATALPAVSPRQFYSYVCGAPLPGQPMQQFSIELTPLIYRKTFAKDSYSAQLPINQKNNLDLLACGPEAVTDVLLHTFQPSLTDLVDIAAYSYGPSMSELRAQQAADGPVAPRVSLSVVTQTAAPIVFSYPGDSQVTRLLGATPVVSDAMAGASIMLFSLGTLALIARKVMLGRSAPAAVPVPPADV